MPPCLLGLQGLPLQSRETSVSMQSPLRFCLVWMSINYFFVSTQTHTHTPQNTLSFYFTWERVLLKLTNQLHNKKSATLLTRRICWIQGKLLRLFITTHGREQRVGVVWLTPWWENLWAVNSHWQVGSYVGVGLSECLAKWGDQQELVCHKTVVGI